MGGGGILLMSHVLQVPFLRPMSLLQGPSGNHSRVLVSSASLGAWSNCVRLVVIRLRFGRLVVEQHLARVGFYLMIDDGVDT